MFDRMAGTDCTTANKNNAIKQFLNPQPCQNYKIMSKTKISNAEVWQFVSFIISNKPAHAMVHILNHKWNSMQ